MARQRIGELLTFGQPAAEPGGQLPPLSLVQLLGKRKLDFPVQPPVGPLVLVRRLSQYERGACSAHSGMLPLPRCSSSLI